MPRQPVGLAKERDGSLCVLTRRFPIHSRRSSSSNVENSNPDFWRVLEVFWRPEKVNRWRSRVFRDPEDPTGAMDACFNMMCLTADLHILWINGTFALRPLRLTDD